MPSGLFPKKVVQCGVLLLMSACLWVFLDRIGPPKVAVLKGWPAFKRTQGDLFAPWRGAQELILHHRDPYSREVAREIQIGYYGKLLDGAPGEPIDEQRFAYPIYVVLLLYPTVRMDYANLRVIFYWLLFAITIVSIPLWFRFIRVRADFLIVLASAAVTISSVPVVQGLNMQQLGLLVVCFLAGSAALLASKRYFWAGVLLGLTSLKPQTTVLLTAWLMLWVFSDWRNRKSLLWGLVSTVAILFAAGEILLPGWFLGFVGGLFPYATYTGGGCALNRLLPLPLAIAAILIAAVTVCVAGWRSRKEPVDSPIFIFTFCLVLTVSLLIIPAMHGIFNGVHLVPALLLLAMNWRSVWGVTRQERTASCLLAAIIISPWVLASVIVPLWLVVPQWGPIKFWLLPLYPSGMVTPATFGLLILFWKHSFRKLPEIAAVRA